MPYKLLLADDSVTVQRVIELTFADEDVQVIAVGDGKQAIDRIEAERPDIVLADVGMPERDGYDVAAFVKHTAHLSHIPVLLLTGAFEPVDEARARAVGCDGVLAKPFEPHMVISRVKELLTGSPPDAAARGGRAVDVPEAVPDSPQSFVGEVSGEREAAGEADAVAPAAPPAEEAALPPVVDASADASLRASRRTPIAVPGFGAPAPPAESRAALDEYFDRLDAAFSTLQQAPAPPGPDTAEPVAAVMANPDGGSPRIERRRYVRPAEPTPAEAAPAAPAAGPRASTPIPGIAQAFSALFSLERGDAPDGDAPGLFGTPLLPQASVDDLVERVTRQVLERLSDQVVRDAASEIVSRVAERLVRDEIERVKATLK